MSNRSLLQLLAVGSLSLWLMACGDDGPHPVVAVPPVLLKHSLGGTVTGATGPLTVTNNVGPVTLVVAGAGTFSFPLALSEGVTYDVVVTTPPTGQSCTVTNGAGTMGTANVSSIAVSCTTDGLTLGGTLSGLAAGGTVVLHAAADFASGNVTLSANGPFVFPVSFVPNSEYLVTVLAQPAGQTCTVANGEGDFGTTAVNNVAVTCINSSASNRDWQPATFISTDTDAHDANGIRKPRVAYDGAGNALAVWEADQVNGSSVYIMWSRRPAGGDWSAPAQIPGWIPPPNSPPAGQAMHDPVLAVAADGTAVAAWRAMSVLGADVMASTYTPSTGWSESVFLWRKHPDEAGGAVDLRIATDAANNTLVVWAAEGLIFYNRYSSGSGWVDDAATEGGGRLVSTGMGSSNEPEMALNAAGQAVALWRHTSQSIPPIAGYDLWSSRYDMATDTWTAPQQVEDGPGDEFYGKSLVIDTGGTATALWSDFDGTRLHVRASRLVGDTWTLPTIVETGNTSSTGFAMDPHAAVDGDGNVIVVWQQGDTEEANFLATRYVPGTVWGGQQVIGAYVGSSSPIHSTQLSVAGNSAGHVVAIWTLSSCVGPENVPCPVDVRANEYNPVNGDWGAEDVIDKVYAFPGDVAGNASTPHVAVDVTGNAVAVWDQDGGATDGIRNAVFE